MFPPRLKLWRMVSLVLLTMIAFWVGASLSWQPMVSAEVRQSPRPEAFLSGSERSLPILMEISATLKRMETRLSNLEKLALEMAKH